MSEALSYWQSVLKPVRRYLSYDSETTGFSMQKDLTVEMGYCRWQNDKAKYDSHLLGWTRFGFERVVERRWLADKLNYVREQMEKNGNSYHVTLERIDNEGLHPVKLLKHYSNRMTEEIEAGGVIAGHSIIHFDIPRLAAAVSEFCGGEFDVPADKIIDTSIIEKSLILDQVPTANENYKQFCHRVRYIQAKGVKHSLSDHCATKYRLLEEYGLTEVDAHAAGFDAMLVHLLIDAIKGLTPATYEKLSKAHERVSR